MFNVLKKSIEPFLRFLNKHLKSTRNSQKLNIPLCKSATGQRSFYYRIVSIWNAISPTLKLSECVSSFKRNLVLSCLVLSCLVLSCLVLSCLVLSCLVLSCLVLSCLVLSCLVNVAYTCYGSDVDKAPRSRA